MKIYSSIEKMETRENSRRFSLSDKKILWERSSCGVQGLICSEGILLWEGTSYGNVNIGAIDSHILYELAKAYCEEFKVGYVHIMNGFKCNNEALICIEDLGFFSRPSLKKQFFIHTNT